MLKNYFKTAFRNLVRNKVNTAINAIGLTLGITCSLVIFLVVRYEMSFNRHFEDFDRMYRVISLLDNEDGQSTQASMQFPFVPAFKSEFSDISATFIHNNMPPPTFFIEKNGERVRFQESGRHAAYVHPDYSEIFSHNWISGNPGSALSNPNSILLTHQMANKLFGRTDVVGEIVGFNDVDMQITGVLEDYPQTTDFPIDIFISIESNEQYNNDVSSGNWGAVYGSVNAFIKLPEGVTKSSMEARLQGFDEKLNQALDDGESMTRLLQPLNELHYNGDLGNYSRRTIDKSTLWAMAVIGILLLVAACINFINLNTALAVRRSKEVGIRKVLGSSRKSLVIQFMGETFIVTFLALLISIGAVELALINMKSYLGYDLQFNLFTDSQAALFLGTIFVFSVIFSGLYPSFVLASYKPIAAIRNKISSEKQGTFSLRKVLVTTQLMISQALIICTVIVLQQMDYFYNSPIGLDKDFVIEMSVPGGQVENHKLLKSRALQIPGVESVTRTNSGAISGNVWFGGYELQLNGETIENSSEIKFVDKDFLSTYGINLLEGSNVLERDSLKNFLVNEQLLKEIGITDYSEVLGKPFSFWGYSGHIGGIVADYNTKSLHSSIEPLVMVYNEGYGRMALKFKTKDIRPLLSSLGSTYTEIFPDRDFNPSFLDETIANFYEEEQKASTLFQIAAGIAILIGCIGMIGLISYVAQQKVKEVGIRKVLGASISNILLLFSRQFLVFTGLGFLIAAPLAYYLMDSWLQDFESRIIIGFDVFAMGLFITAILVILSVGFRAYRSATVNPAQSLRSE
jgi:putative ABC transport system permease protein